MLPLRFHFGRFLIACSAIIGQFIPASAVWACGKSCCSAQASQTCCQRVQTTAQAPDSGCPLCRSQPTEHRSTPPCRCHLNARHDSATKVEGIGAPDLQRPDHFAVVQVSDEPTESSAELMRLVLAAGATVPYRPPRDIVRGLAELNQTPPSFLPNGMREEMCLPIPCVAVWRL